MLNQISNELDLYQVKIASMKPKKEMDLAARIKQLNRAINQMGKKGNSVRFDNYTWSQIIDVQQSFPETKIEIYNLRNANKFYLCIEIEHVVLFSEVVVLYSAAYEKKS